MNKALESLKEIHEVLSFYDSPNLLLSCFELIEKHLKAIEIIKREGMVSLGRIFEDLDYGTFEEYEEEYVYEGGYLPIKNKEEFDLIKEIIKEYEKEN